MTLEPPPDSVPTESEPLRVVPLPSPKKPRDPLAEHLANEAQLVEAAKKNAEANVQAVNATAEAADAMNAMGAHFAAQHEMDRMRLVVSLLAAWTEGRPGRIDRATIADALATIDTLFEIAEVNAKVKASSESNDE